MAVQPRKAATVMLLRESVSEQGFEGVADTATNAALASSWRDCRAIEGVADTATNAALASSCRSGRAIEVFMVRRVVQSEFMPDVYVFPGGSASADDLLAEQEEGICAAVSPSEADPEGRTRLGNGLRAAAIRELFEEANVLLAYQHGAILAVGEQMVPLFESYRRAFHERKGSLISMARQEHLTLATDRLAYFAHWITPEPMPKRYDTHFFLATAPAAQEALYDHLETSEGVWIAPTTALAHYAQNKFPIAFPTYHQLRDLAQFQSVEAALEATKTRYVPAHEPLVTRKDGSLYVSLPEEADKLWEIM